MTYDSKPSQYGSNASRYCASVGSGMNYSDDCPNCGYSGGLSKSNFRDSHLGNYARPKPSGSLGIPVLRSVY